MQSVNTMLLALLVAGHALSAEMPSSKTADERAQSAQTQAQAQAERAREAAERARGSAERARNERESQRAPTEQEALALAALEGLMSQPPERALPIIKKVLGGSQSTLIKRRALFVLSQIDGPEAQRILLDATRSQDAGMRQEAIRSVGIGGNPESLAALQEVYRNGDAGVKQQVLQAWMIAGRKEDVYQAALNAKSEAEADEAIRMLGVMGAVDELRKLSDRPNAGSGLLDAYAIGGDLEGLRRIAEGTGDVAVRSEAVRKIGIIHSDAARTALREIYSRSTSPEIRDAARQGMLINGDDEGVLALYRSATTAEEKRDLLRTLSTMDGDAALKAIDAALEDSK